MRTKFDGESVEGSVLDYFGYDVDMKGWLVGVVIDDELVIVDERELESMGVVAIVEPSCQQEYVVSRDQLPDPEERHDELRLFLSVRSPDSSLNEQVQHELKKRLVRLIAVRSIEVEAELHHHSNDRVDVQMRVAPVTDAVDALQKLKQHVPAGWTPDETDGWRVDTAWSAADACGVPFLGLDPVRSAEAVALPWDKFS